MKRKRKRVIIGTQRKTINPDNDILIDSLFLITLISAIFFILYWILRP